MYSILDDFHISHAVAKTSGCVKECVREREREIEGVANWRYYVGSFRRESIWQIGQSLRGQNFSSGCDDEVETRLPGFQGGGVGLYEDGGRRDGVRKLFRRVHFLLDWWVPFCRWMEAGWTLAKRNRGSGPNASNLAQEFDRRTDFVDFRVSVVNVSNVVKIVRFIFESRNLTLNAQKSLSDWKCQQIVNERKREQIMCACCGTKFRKLWQSYTFLL